MAARLTPTPDGMCPGCRMRLEAFVEATRRLADHFGIGGVLVVASTEHGSTAMTFAPEDAREVTAVLGAMRQAVGPMPPMLEAGGGKGGAH